MKTLGVLLLLAVALGAAYWNTQRPGEGLDALRADVQAGIGRLGDGVSAIRAGGDATVEQADELARTRESVDAAIAASVVASQERLGVASARQNDRSDVLAGRIDALENELTRTMTASEANVVQARLDKLDTRLQALADDIGERAGAGDDATLTRVDALDGRLDLLDRRVDEQDVSARLDALESALDERLLALGNRMDERFEQLADDVNASAAARATFDERLATQDGRLDSLSAGLSPGSTANGSAEEGDGTAAATLDAALDARIVALEQALSGGRAEAVRIDGVQTRLDDLADRLQQQATQDATTSSALEDIERELATLRTDSQALSIDGLQQQIGDQLAALDARVGDSAADDEVVVLTESLEATRERLAQLESRVQDLPASSTAGGRAQEAQSALEAQIAALSRRVERLPQESDPALVSSIDEVREQVDELNARGFVTQDELRAQAEGRFVEYKIYFDKNATDITDDAARVLESFIAQETNRTTGVNIFGFTDRRGPAAYNRQLAQRRAANVRSWLIQNGFDYTKIGNVAGLGEDAAATLLEDEQEDAQQRVVVLFAAQL